jgi:hypothetical protein
MESWFCKYHVTDGFMKDFAPKVIFLFFVTVNGCGLIDRGDPTPFAAPVPLFVVETADVRYLLSNISVTVNNFGFNITNIDTLGGLIEATRHAQNEYDNVIIWMDRDLNDPKYVKVFFLFGRFSGIQDGGSGLRRILIDSVEEEKHVGMLKKSLISLSSSKY